MVILLREPPLSLVGSDLLLSPSSVSGINGKVLLSFGSSIFQHCQCDFTF